MAITLTNDPSEPDDCHNDDSPDVKEVVELNAFRLRRHEVFRIIAENVARELAALPCVRKVALIGSVARPLEKETPRYRIYRRTGLEMWHECRDIDLAVWVDDLSTLRALQRARSEAVRTCVSEECIRPAHHQVELFILEPDTNRYLGRLCCFRQCPRDFKPECHVPGCGDAKYLQQHEGFEFYDNAIAPDRSITLFERTKGRRC